MKRPPRSPRSDNPGLRPDKNGKTYWRSLGELAQTPEFRKAKFSEVPDGGDAIPASLGRRDFLGIMGASFALAGLTGCRKPEEHILPYSHAPEEVIPGRPLHFATVMPWVGGALGLVVESHEGRPTKIEGNPAHPESFGATTAFAQASVLDLYDPDRSKSPTEKGVARTWDEAGRALRAIGERHKASAGEGLVVLTEGHRSPTLSGALKRLAESMPKARIVRYEPLANASQHEGTRLAFGQPLDVALDLARAKVIVSLDADFLATEGSPVGQAHGFAEGRDYENKKDDLSRLYVVESAFSPTGTLADHRLRMQSRQIGKLAIALANELAIGIPGLQTPQLDGRAQKWVSAMAKDLAANKGRAVIIAGRKQPAAVHALVQLINVALGAPGATVHYRPMVDEAPEGPEALAELAKTMGSVKSLVILGGNPAFNAPGETKFGELLKSVETTVHLSTHVDETSEAATWHLNRAHYLEGWADVRCNDGTASIVQPLIAPLYDGKTDIEVVELLSGGTRKGYELVRETWREAAGTTDFEGSFRKALRDGVSVGSAPADVAVTAKVADVARAIAALPADGAGLEVTFSADPHAFDGRFANNSWLQELPDGIHKLTWGNAAAMSTATAKRLGVGDGDVITIKLGSQEIHVPALLAPGHADESIALTVGQGRRVTGRVAKGIGYDTYPIRHTSGFDIATGATVTKAGGNEPLARTQEHFSMEGRPLVLEASAVEFAKDPEIIKEDPKAPPLLALWKEHSYPDAAWGMTIDLNQCNGCNACVVACQSENNIPVVGRESVFDSREMHWIRIDRYFDGPNADEPDAVAQPMLCQHCENAPCEQVCPVGATTHSSEGLNEMAYNRCIGTKYCGNNCPYKVRRFNYFNYSIDLPESRKAQFNPDVTVRFRGVMEKCTFCVQRINHAKIDAKKDGRSRVRDGAFQTACQQACPTDAIHFGDLNDNTSEVAQRAKSGRAYKVLEELNVKPRVSYLARIKNPNPELVGV
jgi:molybdopterin-containing oxidoreductase family iron-sulfur binding subunit